MSPTLVEASPGITSSALLLFTNPFPYPSKFSVAICCDVDSFKFLMKRKSFTLYTFGVEFQIPFSFSPEAIGQIQGSIIVASLGPARAALPELDSMPTIRWVFPIIGNAVEDIQSNTKVLRCRSLTVLSQDLELQLVGETEIFDLPQYVLSIEYPRQFEWIRSVLEIYLERVEKTDMWCNLTVGCKFAPQRPVETSVIVIIRNPMGQEWKFTVQLIVEMSRPIATLTMEAYLKKTASQKVSIPTVVRAALPFHAYFTSSSANEFSVSAKHGLIEPVIGSETELPLEIYFTPKVYGKVFKGMLVIDTIESQFIFDVVGRTPDYVRPEVTEKSARRSFGNGRGRLAKPRVEFIGK
jgi:hypothetical protein